MNSDHFQVYKPRGRRRSRSMRRRRRKGRSSQ